jgi:hypothetical protein
MHVTSRRAVALVSATSLSLLGLLAAPASALNKDQGAALASSTPAGYTPHVMDGSVDAITQVGNKIIAGGTFTKVSPAGTFGDTTDDVVRNGIFAFDATTGVIDNAFNPSIGGAVASMDTDGTSIFVGGSFASVHGNTAIKRLVKLNAAGTVDATFNAVPSSVVNEVVVRLGRVYVGGGFTSIKSGSITSSRKALAALAPATGAVLAGVNVAFTGVYDPNNTYNGKLGGDTNIKAFDVAASGAKLVAIGNFSTVGGLVRPQVAVLDIGATSTTVSGWATTRYDRGHNSCGGKFDTFTRDIDISPGGSYFVVSTTGGFAGGAASGTMCDSTSRWEMTATGNDPSWTDYTGGDTTYGVAIDGSAVYVGGHFRWENNPTQSDQAGAGAVPREGLAALDPTNGLPMSWNPGRSRGVGAQAMFGTSQGLWVGSDTTRLGGETHGRIAFLPMAGGPAIPAVAAATLPNDLFAAQADTLPGSLQRRPVSSTGAPTGPSSTADTTIDWSAVRGAFLLNGTLYYGLTDGGLYSRTFDKVSGGLGQQVPVNLFDDPDTVGSRIPFAIANLTGMLYDAGTHRIYYTVLGDSRLLYRYFTPESKVVGAQTFVANANGVSFASAAGTTLAGGLVLYGSSADGSLHSVPFSGGQVTGTPTVLGTDGSWRSRAMFVPTS